LNTIYKRVVCKIYILNKILIAYSSYFARSLSSNHDWSNNICSLIFANIKIRRVVEQLHVILTNCQVFNQNRNTISFFFNLRSWRFLYLLYIYVFLEAKTRKSKSENYIKDNKRTSAYTTNQTRTSTKTKTLSKRA